MRLVLIATHHADYASNLALALAERHEVLLVLSRRNATRQMRTESLAYLAKRVRLHIVPHHLAPLQPYIAWACLRLIRRFAPDVVHVQEHPTRSMGMLAAMLRGRVPLIATVHDPLPHSGEDAKAAAVFTRYNDRLRHLADGLIVHGSAMVTQLTATGIAADKIVAVNHGVLRYGRLGPEAVAPAVTVDPRRLIFFGRMERYKGLDTLLAANQTWLEAGTWLRLLVAGEGPEIAAHRAALAAPNITLDNRRIPQDELDALVAGSAAAVLPYHDATQSGVIASTFGSGRPVVCSDVGGLAEAVGPAGLLVPPADAGALAAAGRRLIEEPGALARLSTAVAARVAGPLSWGEIGRATDAFYHRSIARHDPLVLPEYNTI